MADWDAELYLRFADERARPARELLARVPGDRVGRIVDLGCGPGNSAALLLARFPRATLTGIDNSDDMLRAARAALPGVRFLKADAALWRAEAPVDLLFANAVLQWLPDHAALLPRLMDQLAPGGILAVQMPDNLSEPTHRLMRETAAAGPWADTLAEASAARAAVLPAEGYYDLLAAGGARVDVWRTTFHHVLDDAGAIVDWVRGTGLRPFLDPLDGAGREAFLAAYRANIAQAYRPRADGRVLLAFPRLFLVAERPLAPFAAAPARF